MPARSTAIPRPRLQRVIIGALGALGAFAGLAVLGEEVARVSPTTAEALRRGRLQHVPALGLREVETDGGPIALDEVWVESAVVLRLLPFPHREPAGLAYLVARVRPMSTRAAIGLLSPADRSDTLWLQLHRRADSTVRVAPRRPSYPDSLWLVARPRRRR